MAHLGFRAQNRSDVLQNLVKRGPMSRAALAEATGLTRAAISRISRELIAAGILVEGESRGPADRPGRRFVPLAFASEGTYVVGLGFEAFAQWLTVANLNGEVVLERPLRLRSLGRPEQVLAHAAREVGMLLDEAGIPLRRVAGMGVAIVGMVDPKMGEVLESPPLGWRRVAVAARLEAALGLPVSVDNLLNATNLAETEFGVCRGRRNVLLVRASLAIGASVISEGVVVRGANFSVGQIGHVRIPGGQRICNCGRTGCLETVASGRAIIADLGEIPARPFHPARFREDAGKLRRVLERAASGETDAVAALGGAGERLGAALESVVALLNPELIVLAGPVGRQPAYVKGVRRGIARHNFSPPGTGTGIAVSTMESQNAAVRLALTEFVVSRRLDIDRLQQRVA